MNCLNVTNISDESHKFNITSSCAAFDFGVYTIVVGTFCLLGFLGNAASFHILRQDNQKTATTAFLLQALAVADTLVLLFAVPLYVLPPVFPYTGYLGQYYALYLDIVAYLWPCYQIPFTGTIYLTVLVSINRYCVVCRHVKGTASHILTKARRHVIYITVFSVLYNIPRFFEYNKIEVCSGFNQSQMGFEISAFGENMF